MRGVGILGNFKIITKNFQENFGRLREITPGKNSRSITKNLENNS